MLVILIGVRYAQRFGATAVHTPNLVRAYEPMKIWSTNSAHFQPCKGSQAPTRTRIALACEYQPLCLQRVNGDSPKAPNPNTKTAFSHASLEKGGSLESGAHEDLGRQLCTHETLHGLTSPRLYQDSPGPGIPVPFVSSESIGAPQSHQIRAQRPLLAVGPWKKGAVVMRLLSSVRQT